MVVTAATVIVGFAIRERISLERNGSSNLRGATTGAKKKRGPSLFFSVPFFFFAPHWSR